MTDGPRSTRVQTLVAYAGVALISFGIIAWLLQLWERDLRVPFSYFGDAVYYAAQLKNFVEHGTFMHQPSLGAPGEVFLHDFPNSEPFHFWVMAAFCKCGLEVGTSLNVYYLLSYPLTAVSAMFVLRHFRLGFGPSAVAGILFTFLYYHLARGEIHICLAAYYLVPLMMMVILWVMQPGCVFFKGAEHRAARVGFAVVVSALLAVASIYYSFFACYLLLVAGIASALKIRSLRPLVSCGLLIVVISGVLGANLIESQRYSSEHGANPAATVRHPDQAETFALKITQLVLPVTNHRVESLARLKDYYNANQGFGATTNENNMASLGIVGSLGFVVLLLLILFQLPSRPASDSDVRATLPRDLSVLNLALVLLGTLGGIGMMFAVLVSPMIRSYNRVSVMIAFAALFLVAIGLDNLRRRWAASGVRAAVFHVLLGVLTVGGLLDQIPKEASREHQRRVIEFEEARFASDRAFLTKIRSRMPDEAMVFQLPHQGFPEEPPAGDVRMVIYDHLLGFLHARGLRWSFGAVRGRGTDDWLRRVSTLPTPEFLRVICAAGFTGLWVDSFGYTAEQRQKIGVEIVEILGEPTIPSENGRYFFFDLRAHVAQLRAKVTDARWEEERLRALPVRPYYGAGFLPPQQDSGVEFRWAGRQSALYLDNPLPRSRRVHLKFDLASASGSGRLDVGGAVQRVVDLRPEPVSFEATLEVPANSARVVLRLECDVAPPADPESRPSGSFRISNVRIEDVR